MMPIKRAPRRMHFTTIPNQGLQDADMSFKARGLLAYMLTLPDDWTFYERELIEHTTDGRDAVRSALRELVAHGYLIRTQTRNSGGGFNNSEWTVYDTPQQPLTENASAAGMPSNQDSVINSTANAQPLTEKPATGNPRTDNPPLLNTNLTKDLPNKETTTTTPQPRSNQGPLKPLQDFWEQNGFGMVNGGTWWQEFGEWHSDFKKLGATDQDATQIIIRAMRECVDAGTRTRNMKYLRSILTRYANTGFKSVADIDADEAAHKASQSQDKAPTQRRSTNPGVYLDHSLDKSWDDWEKHQRELQRQFEEKCEAERQQAKAKADAGGDN